MKKMQSVPFSCRPGKEGQEFQLPIRARNIRLLHNFAVTDLIFEVNIDDLASGETETWVASWLPDNREVPDDAIALRLEIYQGGSFTKETEVLWLINKKAL